MRPCQLIRVCFVLALLIACGDREAVPGEEAPAVRVAEGFEVSLFADDDLAHDIYCLTIDSQGRVVVSGPGYVRILLDRDGDGRADEFRTFAEPTGGAQGMTFHGSDLICTAEGGLVRYRDRNGDDRSDGPPDVFLKLKTGGEHDAHAVRRGPDGWWYLLVGNSGGISKRYITTTTSPVRSPRAGVLMRLAPDLNAGEVFADGFRNAYDFAFDPIGEVVTCDSDGERDVSLPWYLPTRCLQVLPGADAGWVTESWKRQDAFLDMPPLIASLGRGSPTGVVCYRHVQFPPAYHACLFVLDWTYGKIYALRPRQSGASVIAEPEVFLEGVGGHGFAPTSAAVGPDGSLYVSVGGRGTRGGVYRIRAQHRPEFNPLKIPVPESIQDRLTYCLRCPEPLSSWSRQIWEPIARELGSEPFIQAAQEETRLAIERLRAVEILTELYHGLDADLLTALARSSQPAVRVRAAWAIGRSETADPRAHLLAAFLGDAEPFVVRAGLEALLGADSAVLAELIDPLAQSLNADDRFVRQAAIRVVARADEDTYQAIAAAAAPLGWQAGISLGASYAIRHPGVDPYSIDIALKVLRGGHPVSLKREAVRLLQVGLGDCGAGPPGVRPARPAVFDAYASALDLTSASDVISQLQTVLPPLYPQGDADLDRELARTLAMVRPDDSAVRDRLLAHITETSDPVEDLHLLIVLSRLPGERTESQRARIADALLQIEPKFQARRLVQDRHWNDRVMEMCEALAEHDPDWPVALLRHPEFGRPGHAQFLALLGTDHIPEAMDLYTRRVQAGGDAYEWNADIVYLLSHAEDPQVRELVRGQFAHFGLRAAVLLALSEEPREEDRELFLAGLDESSFDVLQACVRALTLLPPNPSAEENVALLRSLRRLGSEGQERGIRDQVVEALRRNTGQHFGYGLAREGDPQTSAIGQWTDYISRTFPAEYARETGSVVAELDELKELLAGVPWGHGSVERGATLFQRRACQQCHSSSRALGPDLSGAANRFSRLDLFTAIAIPSRDVSPRYQSELIVTADGRSYAGLVVYEAVDGLVLRDAHNRTYRIESGEIEARRRLQTSLMPTGLLKDLQPSDLADLYAYLQSLSATAGAQTAREGGVSE